jgi:hypothetical protein
MISRRDLVVDGDMKISSTCLALFICALMTGSCSDDTSVQSESIEGGPGNVLLNRIRKDTGVEFPVETTVVHFHEPDRVVDPVWVAKVLVPPGAFDSLKKVVLAKPTDNTTYHGALSNSTSWWKPEDVLLERGYLADRQTFVKMIFSEESPNVAVYIEAAVF